MNVDAAIRRALEKLPADRFTGAQTFAKALADPAFRHGESAVAAAAAPGRWKAAALTLGLTTAALAGALGWAATRPEPPQPVERFSIEIEPVAYPVLLPDGSGAVVGGTTEGGQPQLMLRTWDDLTPRPIAGTQVPLTSGTPTVSPDGREVAFITGTQLRVVPLEGGGVRTLADSAFCCESWGPDGYVYYTSTGLRNIMRVRAAGGVAEKVTSPDTVVNEGYFRLAPGGEVAVLTSWSTTGSGSLATIEAIRLSTGERKVVTEGAKGHVTATGHLVFASSQGQLLAAPFDAESLELTAAPVMLAEGIVVGDEDPIFSLSPSGSLAYVTGGAGGAGFYGMVWVSRTGQPTPIDPEWQVDVGDGNAGWSLSPDGRRLAVREIVDGNSDVWIKELPAGPRSRLTFDGAVDRRPRWAPDGRSVTFVSDRAGDLDIWSRRADGTGDPSRLFDFERGLAEGFWSPDGAWLVMRVGGLQGSDEGARDIMGFRPGVDSVAVPLVATPQYSEESPAVSPDGRWLAYTSTETGRVEVYVRPFPNVDDDKIPVSRSGGFSPLWSPNGRELFFVNLETRELLAAQVSTAGRFQVTSIETLFTIPDGFFMGRSADFYDIMPDGERFVMARLSIGGEQFAPELILVQNWIEELKERVPR